MTVLVTGGCGFIGSRIVRALVERGENVRVLDNLSRGSTKLPNVDYQQRDIRDLQYMHTLYNGVDEIIHAAYINGTKTFYERPDEVLEVGVKGIVNLLDGCSYHDIRKFILISSSEVCRAQLVGPNETIPLVIPDPFNSRYSYSAGKIISEMMCIHSKLIDRLLIARPFNIYGPGMSQGHVIPDFIAQLDKTEFKIIGSGRETRSFCYIDDFIQGFMLMRDKGKHKGIYNIGTEDEITIRDMAYLLADVAGQKIMATEAGELREGDLLRRKPDTSKLRALGFKPQVNLAEGLRRTLEWSRGSQSLPA